MPSSGFAFMTFSVRGPCGGKEFTAIVYADRESVLLRVVHRSMVGNGNALTRLLVRSQDIEQGAFFWSQGCLTQLTQHLRVQDLVKKDDTTVALACGIDHLGPTQIQNPHDLPAGPG